MKARIGTSMDVVICMSGRDQNLDEDSDLGIWGVLINSMQKCELCVME
jgi:hypothetical protein